MSEKKEKKYLIDNPTLMAEWNLGKNNELQFDPRILTVGSGRKVWWKCGKGHEWQAIIANRSKGVGCPFCASQKVLKGYNDLATVNPSLAAEWNNEKNGNLTPEKVTSNSAKKVWWRCDKSHEWQSIIANRSKGLGCPICANQKILKGYNDLATLNPFLATEWNYEKNGNLNPEDVAHKSNKKIWWKCNKGHEWRSTIANRNKGNACPHCNAERRTSFPEYALLFYLKKCGVEAIHSYKEKGYELDVYIPSKKIAIEYDGSFWHKTKKIKDLMKNKKCRDDGIILYRIRQGLQSLGDTSIDYIIDESLKDLDVAIKNLIGEITQIDVDVNTRRDAVEIEKTREYTEKENSLLVLNPTIAKEWDYEKNGRLKPENFSIGSEKKFWWKCINGHEWQASIADRSRGRGCPICLNRKILKGYNDLQTLNPKLASEWNYGKNGDLKPEEVALNSGKKVWWKCNNGHEWQATIDSRSNGCGCPYCSNKKVLAGYNDLETTIPILAKEWNYEKNVGLTPKKVTANSGKKVWWKCTKGHEWQAMIYARNKGTGCPYCSGRKKAKE